MSEREGGGVRVRNGMLVHVVEGRRTDRPLLPRPGKVVHDQTKGEDVGCACFHCLSVCLRVVDQGIYK